MTGTYSVWTTNDDPAWVARNGTNEMVLFGGQQHLSTARKTCERLLIIAPDKVFEIRDGSNQVISTFELRPAIRTPGGAQPKRRALGSRGV